MKRLLVLILVMVLAVYALPLATVGLGKGETDAEKPQDKTSAADGQDDANDVTLGEAVAVSGSGYDEKTRITVCVDGESREMDLHTYLCGVLCAEMPASFPEEALKAQAVAARTYTLYKIKSYEQGVKIPDSHKGAQLCGEPSHCKAYRDMAADASSMWGDKSETYQTAIDKAVKDTDGIIATYEGEPIAAVFHAASSEKTERAVDVWGGERPYLQSVESPGGDASSKYHGTVKVTADEFRTKFKEKYPQAKLDGAPNTWFKASNRSEAGGVINVAVGGVRVTGDVVRRLFGLNSTNFALETTADSLTFQTTGYGHGVGMSQYGARELALEGKTYDQILKWYYTGIDLTLKS